MLAKLARLVFLVTMATLVAAYAVTLANSSPPPMDPTDFVVQWC